MTPLLYPFFLLKVATSIFIGSYSPYVPRDEDIVQLKTFLASLNRHTSKINSPLQLNYHLLKFIQENCLADTPMNSQNEPPTCEVVETMWHDAHHLGEEKELAKPCSSPRWLPCFLPAQLSSQPQPLQPIMDPSTADSSWSSRFLSVHSGAILTCQNCKADGPSVEIGFSKQDEKNTLNRFNFKYDGNTLDSAVRGSIIAAQPQISLPEVLSFVKGVNF